MIETLQSGTMLTGYALLASPTTTSVKGVKFKEDKEGHVTADLKIPRTLTATAASVITTAAPSIQEQSYQNTINSIEAEQAIVEVASQEELARALSALDDQQLALMLEEAGELTTTEHEATKAPYTK